MLRFRKKINHAYDVLTSSLNSTKDEDTCFGEYVGHSLKNIEDSKTKAWVRHNISNILFQGQVGRAGYPFQSPSTFGLTNYPYHPHPFINPSSSTSPCPTSLPSPQSSNNQPQYYPDEMAEDTTFHNIMNLQ